MPRVTGFEKKRPFLVIQYYIDLPCIIPSSGRQPIFREVHTLSFCLLLYIITKVFMPVIIHRSESNTIYQTHYWGKTPLLLPFYNVGFTKLLSEVILHISKLGQEKKNNILGTSFLHLQTAGWLQVCPIVASQWKAAVVSIKYLNLERSPYHTRWNLFI